MFCFASLCAPLSSWTFSLRLVCFLWTVLPCLFMFRNTIAYAFRCQPRKQLYLIAFVDLVPVATEKCTIHKGEPEPQKGNVNTVYFTGLLIFCAVAEPRISTKSAKSREIHQNTQNPAKFARNLYQIHVGTIYLKVILAVGVAYLL